MDHSALSSRKHYPPLAVTVAATLLAASAKQAAYGAWNWMPWMDDFMGFYFVVFSMFKFWDLSGFADGFQKYDLLAEHVRSYAILYPFIEVGLGLGYLAHWRLAAVNTVTIFAMALGALGVIRALAKGLDLESVCMGTVHKMPLSAVALIENLAMAGMAGGMLVMR